MKRSDVNVTYRKANSSYRLLLLLLVALIVLVSVIYLRCGAEASLAAFVYGGAAVLFLSLIVGAAASIAESRCERAEKQLLREEKESLASYTPFVCKSMGELCSLNKD